jgi:hypothetical protein
MRVRSFGIASLWKKSVFAVINFAKPVKAKSFTGPGYLSIFNKCPYLVKMLTGRIIF